LATDGIQHEITVLPLFTFLPVLHLWARGMRCLLPGITDKTMKTPGGNKAPFDKPGKT